MASRPSTVTKAELERYLKAWQAAGYSEPRAEIKPDGTVILLPSAALTPGETPLDAWRRENGQS